MTINEARESLIEKAKRIGFSRVEGKSDGVLEKRLLKHGEIHHIVLLTSNRDATMLIDPQTPQACKFQFKHNYERVAEFINDYATEVRDE